MSARLFHGNERYTDSFELGCETYIDSESVIVCDALALRPLQKDTVLGRAKRNNMALEFVIWDLCSTRNIS